MKKILLISFIIFCLTSCFCIKETKPANGKEKNMTPCDSLRSFLAENWHYDDSLDVYACNDKAIFEEMQVHEGYRGKYWSCMGHLTPKSTIRLFGVPNESKETELWYYLDGKCFNGMKDGCKFLCFYFNKDSTFKESIITWVRKTN